MMKTEREPLDAVIRDEVARRFERQAGSAPVVDPDGKLIGRITIDDVVDGFVSNDHSLAVMAGLVTATHLPLY